LEQDPWVFDQPRPATGIQLVARPPPPRRRGALLPGTSAMVEPGREGRGPAQAALRSRIRRV
jgi:hypothetical protein